MPLPNTGDTGWGTTLNNWLLGGHNTDGSHDAADVAFSPTGTIAATTVQDAIAEVASEGGSSAATLSLADYVTDFTGATDQTSEVEAAIADLPATGGIIDHPGGKVKIDSAIDISDTYVGFRGTQGGLDNNTAVGSWFLTGTASQTLFSCRPATLRQTGPSLERIGLLDTVGDCLLLDIRNTNRVVLRDCLFSGFGGAGAHTTTAVEFSHAGGGMDSAWHHLDNVGFRSCQTGILGTNCLGLTMVGGFFSAGYDCIGADLQSVSSARFLGVKSDGCNPVYRSVGSSAMNSWIDCAMESTDGAHDYVGFEIDGAGTGTTGYGNSIRGCRITGTTGAGASVGIALGANSAKTYVNVRFVTVDTSYTDAGIDNDIYVIGKGWQTPIRFVSDTSGPVITTNAGTPESVVTARVGSLCMDYTNGVVYVKKSGSGTTGWRQITQDVQIEVTEKKALNASAQTTTTAVVPIATVAAGSTAVLATTSLVGKVISSVSDSQGNTWVVDITANDGTRALSFASAPVTTALTTSDTVTITWAAATSSAAAVWLMQVDNLSASPFDKSNTGTGTSTAPLTSPTATLAQARELVLCIVRTGADSTFTPGSGFIAVETPIILGRSMLEYKNVNATTAVTGSGTLGTSGTWHALVATYKQV